MLSNKKSAKDEINERVRKVLKLFPNLFTLCTFSLSYIFLVMYQGSIKGQSQISLTKYTKTFPRKQNILKDMLTYYILISFDTYFQKRKKIYHSG